MPKRFNVRVYGILVQNDSLLVSDEYIRGMEVTKFPGGGLEPGEGPADCLVREFREELDLEISIRSHFYTTDFFVASAFDPDSQVISIYYEVNALSPLNFAVSEKPHNYERTNGAQSFRWISLDVLKETDFTLVIDRRVGAMLAAQFQK